MVNTEHEFLGSPGAGEERLETKIRRTLLTLAIVLTPPALLFLYFKLTFAGLTHPEALDFAQLGRNLSAGRGFVTEIIRPLALTQGTDPLRQQEVVHGPLYPILLALGFGALGAKEWVAALVSGFFYLATLPLIYVLGRRVFNPTVGLIGMGLFAVNARILEYAVSGLHITLYIFLSTALLLTLHGLAAEARDAGGENPPFPRGRLVLAGVLTAALYLTDPIFFWVVPGVALSVLLIHRKQWLRAGVTFLVPFGVLTAGWMLRNANLTGNPIFGLSGHEVFMNTTVYPGDEGYRMFPGELAPGLPVFKAILKKVGLGLGQVIETLPSLTASWVLAFFVPSLFFRFNDPAANRLRGATLGFAGALLAGMLLFRIELPLFVTVVPVLLLFAVAFLLHLARQAQFNRFSSALACLVLGTLAGYPLVKDLALTPRGEPLSLAAYAEAFGPMTRKRDVILTDQPWLVAWHAESPCVWIPAQDKRVPEAMSHFGKVRWMFLSGQVRGLSRGWQSVYNGFAEGIYERERLRAANEPYPEKVRINATGDPMLEAVSGSTWVPIGERPTLDVIVASLPGDETRLGLGDDQPESESEN